MILTFFGTGTSTGVPVIGCQCATCQSTDPHDKRLRTSAYIETPNANILIDAGPDFRQQMLVNGKSDITAVLLTHIHYDHVGGLDDLRGVNYSQRHGIEIYARPDVADAVKKNLYYAFSEHPYPGAPRMTLHPISLDPFKIADLTITPLPVMHASLPIVGYRINDLGYITDAKTIPASTIELLRGVHTLVLNALAPLEHPAHLSLQAAIEIAREVKAERTYFTHISHNMGLQSVVGPTLPANMYLAYDSLRVEVG